MIKNLYFGEKIQKKILVGQFLAVIFAAAPQNRFFHDNLIRFIEKIEKLQIYTELYVILLEKSTKIS